MDHLSCNAHSITAGTVRLFAYSGMIVHFRIFDRVNDGMVEVKERVGGRNTRGGRIAILAHHGRSSDSANRAWPDLGTLHIKDLMNVMQANRGLTGTCTHSTAALPKHVCTPNHQRKADEILDSQAKTDPESWTLSLRARILTVSTVAGRTVTGFGRGGGATCAGQGQHSGHETPGDGKLP